MAGDETYERTVEVGLVLGVAEALRAEFGVGIDAHPGGPGSEAGVVNRAFRASARRILRSMAPEGKDLEEVVTRALRLTSLRRLAEIGVTGKRAEDLIDQEPALGHTWLAYVALAPDIVIEESAVKREGGDQLP